MDAAKIVIIITLHMGHDKRGVAYRQISVVAQISLLLQRDHTMKGVNAAIRNLVVEFDIQNFGTKKCDHGQIMKGFETL